MQQQSYRSTEEDNGTVTLLCGKQITLYDAPADLICPITHELFTDPVILPTQSANTFEKTALQRHLRIKPNCPLSREYVDNATVFLVPDRARKREVGEFLRTTATARELIISYNVLKKLYEEVESECSNHLTSIAELESEISIYLEELKELKDSRAALASKDQIISDIRTVLVATIDQNQLLQEELLTTKQNDNEGIDVNLARSTQLFKNIQTNSNDRNVLVIESPPKRKPCNNNNNNSSYPKKTKH